MKIVSIVGARPNLMKIAPLLAEMRQFPDVSSVLVHTGQHYDDKMSQAFFRDLNLPQPEYNLEVGSGSHTIQTAQMMIRLDPLLDELEPDLVLTVGDVNSTLAAALVASKRGIPLAHVEAGLRSFDRSMPEEINRVVTDSLSDHLFTTERSANHNLAREGIPEAKVHFVGNVMIDTLLKNKEKADALSMPKKYGLSSLGYVVMTLHRPSNVDYGPKLEDMIETISAMQELIPVVFPIHPRTRRKLEEYGLMGRVNSFRNLKIIDPLGYLEFLGLMSQARVVVTDSGGIQEETTILGVSCLTIRDNTERPVTISEGTNRLVGTVPDSIIKALQETLSGPISKPSSPELWDGQAARRIVQILVSKK